MAQVGLNYEKNWRSKISLDCPYKGKDQRNTIKNNHRVQDQRATIKNNPLAVFWICIRFHADPDPGSLKCPYGSGSGSRPLIFYSDPDPKGVKIKEDNLYKQIFN